MQIAVLADIHSNHIALQTCVQEARKRGAEAFLFLGDYIGEMAYPQKNMDILAELNRTVPCTFIRGNKEEYWMDHRKGKHADWQWESRRSGSGMLHYAYERLTPWQIEAFAELPISCRMEYPGYPPFVICHGSPWNVSQSMRPDYAYMEDVAKQLDTELTICGHFHIQCLYERCGKRIVNPGAVGVPLRSGGRTQFMMLQGRNGQWNMEFVTLPYDAEAVIREMDEENLCKQAPGWYRITRSILRGGDVTQKMLLNRACELCERETGNGNWKDIPEKYWNMALLEFGIE